MSATTMLKGSLISVAALLACAVPTAHAGVFCELSNYTVDSYDHSGVYLHGRLAGTDVQWISLCVGGTQAGCSSQGTGRLLAVALAAQAQGKSLQVYFESLSSCGAFAPYTAATSLRIPA